MPSTSARPWCKGLSKCVAFAISAAWLNGAAHAGPLTATGTTALVPSSARAPGLGGAFYTTDLTVANTGIVPTTFVLKFLGNSADGRSGPEKSYSIGANSFTTFPDVLGTVFGLTKDFGAIRITSPSDALRAIAQTSTPGFGGTFGQSVPAARPEDLVTFGTTRSILGAREDTLFRTNLILANATEARLDVDVQLIWSEGSVLARKRYLLEPLGMTQVTKVVRDMGVETNLDGVRLVVSTPTAGGAFAAYASAIDNVTNDPRTLMPGVPTSGLSMLTPYVNESDMASVNEAFATGANAPWGFPHDGVDFTPKGDGKAFQAVAPGVVQMVELRQNGPYWQVNVWVQCDSATSYDYAFEPFTSQQQDGQTQLSNVFVSIGQPVSPGDLIGRLHLVNSGSHTHFAVRTNFQAVCPEPYFSDPARQSILRLLRAMWPGANMCY